MAPSGADCIDVLPLFQLTIPVDLRQDTSNTTSIPRMGCKFSQVHVRLPSNIEGAIPRLWDVRRRMEELKTSPDTVVMYGAIYCLLPILPEVVAQWILNTVFRKVFKSFFYYSLNMFRIINRFLLCSSGVWHNLLAWLSKQAVYERNAGNFTFTYISHVLQASVVLANVPGPEEVLMLGSKQLKKITFWMSPRPEIPVVFSIISYAGTIQMSISADKSIVPQPQALVQEFTNEVCVIPLPKLKHFVYWDITIINHV